MLKDAVQKIYDYCSNKKIAIAVSGGIDSSVLLSLVLSCGYVKKNDVTVLHVNHHLRKEADLDEQFVRQTCKDYGVKLIVKQVDVLELCAKNKVSEETAGREARRDFFYEVVNSGKVDCVLTAHHSLDNAESVLMHLFRGSGLNGMRGIEVCDDIYVRPLINTQKQDIIEYANRNQIKYVQDNSNKDSKYTRNFIRNEVIPLIETRYPAVVSAISRFSDFVKEEYSFGFDVDCDEVVIPYSDLEPARVLVALKELGAVDYESKHFDIITNMHKLKRGARICLKDGITAINDYGKIILTREEFVKLQEEYPFAFGDFDEIEVKVEKAELPINFGVSKSVLYVDSDKIPDGSVFRARKDGDRFTPYKGNEIKLKKYLIDKKIPHHKRDKLACLCYNDEVLAIAGVEISNKLAVTEKTVNVATIIYTGELYE